MIGTTDLSALPGRANPIFLEGKLLPISAEQAQALALKDSEVVQALVRSRGADDLGLLIRGRSLSLPATPVTSGWLPGQTVSLQVQSLAASGLALVPLADAAAAQSAAPAFFSRVGQLLFRPPGLDQLSRTFKPGLLDALLKLSGRSDLQAQWQGMQLSMAQLHPLMLKQALSAAMGSEVWLARGQLPPADDPKQLLKKLTASLSDDAAAEGEGGEIREAIERLGRAVEDIEASQVQAVQAQAQRELLFSFVLPFSDADPVQLQFRRAPRRGGDDAPPLVVNVHSHNQALGELWLKTQLHGLDRVDLTMWALKESVVERARERSAELGQQLSDAGLAMQSFQVIHGARPLATQDWTPSGRGMVVDIRA